MIISPRAKEVIDVLRIENNDGRIIEIDEVFLYHRTGVGAPYRKTLYWKRSEDVNMPESANNDAGTQNGE